MKKQHAHGLPPVRTVCFTGHRVIPVQHALRLPDLLDSAITSLVERGATVFRAGGAVGFDTVAALKVLELRERYPQMRLELILPCRDQTKHWSQEDAQVYAYILAAADSHRFLFDSYVDGCMLERDRRLVSGSDVCVAYLTRSHGGTAYTFSQAIRAGLETVNLYDDLR
jgi:uncharacterized phage-like protein YoqJ